MAKIKKVEEIEVVQEEVIKTSILKLNENYSREDLNEIARKINEIIDRIS